MGAGTQSVVFHRKVFIPREGYHFPLRNDAEPNFEIGVVSASPLGTWTVGPTDIQDARNNFAPDIIQGGTATFSLTYGPLGNVNVSHENVGVYTAFEQENTISGAELIEYAFSQKPRGGDILTKLQQLLQEEEDDDEYDLLAPTSHAILQTIELIIGCSALDREDLPPSFVCSDSDGGIRIEWFFHGDPGREIRLVVPPTENAPPYIYFEEGNSYGGEQNVSASMLSRWLVWLLNV